MRPALEPIGAFTVLVGQEFGSIADGIGNIPSRSAAEIVVPPDARLVFDQEWYFRENPDVADAGVDGLIHYLQLGGFEGKDPCPLFDSDWYLRMQCPEGRLAGLNPLVHYLKFGAEEGRDPHPLFHTDWYVRQNPDLPAGVNPLVHYVTKGAIEGRPPSEMFVKSMALPPVGAADAVVSVFPREEPVNPKISVVIPVFNKAGYLPECLNSVLAQSLKEIEVICVNDGSSDGSRDVLQEYYERDGRVIIVDSPRSLGAAVARNIGINCSRGEFLQFTDADDVLPQSAFEKLYEATRSDGVEVVRGGLAEFSDLSASARCKSFAPASKQGGFDRHGGSFTSVVPYDLPHRP